MSATLTLFTRWKALKRCDSSREALRMLGLSSGAAVHWNAGRNADAHVIARMAKDLGEDAAPWLALAESERAKSDADRKTWALLAKRLGAAAALSLVAVALPHYSEAHHALALLSALPVSAEPLTALCITRSGLLAVALIALVVWSRRGHSTSPMLA